MQEKITMVNADQTGIRLERQRRSERRIAVNDVLKMIGLVGGIAVIIAVLVMGTLAGDFFGAVIGAVMIAVIGGFGALIAFMA